MRGEPKYVPSSKEGGIHLPGSFINESFLMRRRKLELTKLATSVQPKTAIFRCWLNASR